jgi:hypothetical protein
MRFLNFMEAYALIADGAILNHDKGIRILMSYNTKSGTVMLKKEQDSSLDYELNMPSYSMEIMSVGKKGVLVRLDKKITVSLPLNGWVKK